MAAQGLRTLKTNGRRTSYPLGIREIDPTGSIGSI
jgi:hypothetical protein